MTALPADSPRASLERLLASLFDAEHLRRFLRHGPEGEVVSAELPTTAFREAVHAAVNVLERRGLIDVSFFDRLRSEFPRRSSEIRAVYATWIVARPEGEDCPSISFADSEPLELADRLEAAYRRREELIVEGADCEAIDRELLELRRQIRRGPQLHPGESLLGGRYRLIAILGSGGFATVWRAYDRETRRVVAVKVLHGQWCGDRTHRERFIRGARTMAQLRHPNIVRVLREPCDDEGFLFYVMDLIEGASLHKAVLAGQLDAESAARLLLPICDALSHAHARGFVHRDVKPSNILLDRGGNAFLSDFDLIRGEDTTGGTRTGAGIGTLFYAAPEALADASRADARADVYGMGMILLFAALGRDLRIDDLYDVHNGYIAAPPALVPVIDRASARHVDRRCASMQEFKDDLELALSCWRSFATPGVESVVDTIADEEDSRPLDTGPLFDDANSDDEDRAPPPPGPDVSAPVASTSGEETPGADTVLLIVEGPALGTPYTLAGGETTIGRGTLNDIVIASHSVSRTHALLRVDGREVQIRDNKSTNGTYVNDVRIVEASLKDGDLIKIGGTTIKVLRGEDLESRTREVIRRLEAFDETTHLYNKGHFSEALRREIVRARRRESPLSLIVFDIDRFKALVDAYGQQAGDFVLRGAADSARLQNRKIDVLARYGNDEFALLLPELDAPAAIASAERLRKSVAAANLDFNGQELRVTVSVGVAGLEPRDASPGDLLDRAEARMLAARRAGGDKVVSAD